MWKWNLNRTLVRLECLSYIALCVFSSTAIQAGDAHLEFNRDVRPILAAACFNCHGFDEKGRQAALRLDDQESAYLGGESGQPAVVREIQRKVRLSGEFFLLIHR